MKILVVEDSRCEIRLPTQQVDKFGATMFSACSTDEALESMTTVQPDLVFLDAALPDGEGSRIAQAIRANEKPGEWTPIIFLLSGVDDPSIAACVAAGGDDYLLKPVSEIALGAKIRALQHIVLMRSSMIALTRKLDAANQELVRIASCDGLTGVSNRRYFNDAMSIEWRRARRHSNSIAMLMCDIDQFRLFNERYGHLAGDDCLRAVATALRRHAERPSDIVARFGPEEFAVVLPETTISGALMVAEKIRTAIRELHIPHAAVPGGQVSLSIGVASAAPGFDNPPDDLVEAAEKALLRAKEEGRDRVCRADAT
ncbi:MAG: diguanylate cyclase [Proteobacteria bacterium]|nr:diguanylate cyclase [Pseudomonadota bacterium]